MGFFRHDLRNERWSIIMLMPVTGRLRTQERVADHNQEILHSVHPDQFLQQLKIQRRIGRTIRDQYALNFCLSLPINFLDEREFFRCHQIGALVSLGQLDVIPSSWVNGK